MKELGTRYEGDGAITIVELTEYEKAVLSDLLNTRDLGKEEAELKSWAGRFTKRVMELGLDVRTYNALAREVWNSERYGAGITFSLTENGPPLEFDEWVRRIVKTHDNDGRPLRGHTLPMLAVKNCGVQCKKAIMSALAQYLSESSPTR